MSLPPCLDQPLGLEQVMETKELLLLPPCSTGLPLPTLFSRDLLLLLQLQSPELGRWAGDKSHRYSLQPGSSAQEEERPCCSPQGSSRGSSRGNSSSPNSPASLGAPGPGARQVTVPGFDSEAPSDRAPSSLDFSSPLAGMRQTEFPQLFDTSPTHRSVFQGRWEWLPRSWDPTWKR